MGNPAINCYQDRDGRWFWLIGLEGDRHWPDLCRAVGHPEWVDDERFATASGRRHHVRELIPALDAIFATAVPAPASTGSPMPIASGNFTGIAQSELRVP